MSKDSFKGKKVAVLGFGVEGESSARYLVQNGATVTVLDQKRKEQFNNLTIEQLRSLGVRFVFGENYLKDLSSFDVIVRSPGVKRNLPEIVAAEKKGVLITSQTKIFFDLCPGKIIGVTGTKGKGTTASLIYEMIEKDGENAYLGGNIGEPPLDFLDKLNPQSLRQAQGRQWVVLELSSFQLLDLTKSPHIAVILMVTSEHLAADKWGTQNYHDSHQEYVEAKRNILRFQTASDAAIINRDYPASNESDVHTEGKVFRVSRERDVYEQGCFVKDGKVIIRLARGPAAPSSHPTSSEKVLVRSILSRAAGFPAGARWDPLRPRHPSLATRLSASPHQNVDRIVEEEIIDVKEILLPGKHNLENVCAAVMVAKLAGVSNKNIASVLKTFKGLEHRLELVREVNGVRYYDDSFSTTPETAIAAIEAFRNPEILILGGSSKGSDFSELGRVISQAKNIKAVIGIGVEWKRIKSEIRNPKSEIRIIEGLKTMREIVFEASEQADPGDVVILSPACASFDMFKNYKDRGEQFKEEVRRL